MMEPEGNNNSDSEISDEESKEILTSMSCGHSTSSSSANPGRHEQGGFVLPIAAAVASLGGICFGYDIGIISGALLQLRCIFNLSCYQQEMIVTTLVIGALVCSFCGGVILDKYGRKLTIILNALLFILGATVLAAAHSFHVFVIGRFIVGFSVCLSAVADCVYISEIAPPNKRGLLVSMNEMGITIGILLAYLMNYFLVNVHDGWRYMFAISGFPALLQALGMLFLPESPRWLISAGKELLALKVSRVLWPLENSDVVVEKMKNCLSAEKNFKFADLFSKVKNMRTRMMIGSGIALFQQLSGQPTVLYYAPILLQNLGYGSNDSATLATIGLGVVKMVFTFITLCSVDKLGRRTFLLMGVTLLTLSLVVLSGLTVSFSDQYSHDGCKDVGRLNDKMMTSNGSCHLDQKSMNMTPSSVGIDLLLNVTETGAIPKLVKYASLISLFTFVTGFAIGYGPISWLILSEIFPTGIKGRAVSTITSVNWGANILVSMTFLELMNALGPFGIFLIYACVGIFSLFFIFQFVPETRGKSLEMLDLELTETLGNTCSLRTCVKAETLPVEEHCQLLDNEAEPHNEAGVEEDQTSLWV